MQFRRRLTPINQINLIPMIDIAFQLVFFFMVTSTFIVTPGIRISLPKATTAEPVIMDRLIVTVLSPTRIYLNNEQYDLAGLNQRLSQMNSAQRGAIKSVVLEADKDISYNLMVQVLDVLRQNGLQNVNLKLAQGGPAGQ